MILVKSKGRTVFHTFYKYLTAFKYPPQRLKVKRSCCPLAIYSCTSDYKTVTLCVVRELSEKLKYLTGHNCHNFPFFSTQVLCHKIAFKLTVHFIISMTNLAMSSQPLINIQLENTKSKQTTVKRIRQMFMM